MVLFTILSVAGVLGLAGAEEPFEGLPLGQAEEWVGAYACTTCHAAPDAAWRYEPKSAPSLADAGQRLGPSWMRRYLTDPHATKTWGTMPDQLAGLEEAERAAAVEDLVHFLASLGAGSPDSFLLDSHETVFIDELERGRIHFHELGCVACHAPEEPAWQLDARLQEFWEAEAAGEELFEFSSADEPEERWIPPGTLNPPGLPLNPLVSDKYTAASLSAFLLDPLSRRPSGAMPSLGLDERQAREIAVYLLRERARPRGEALTIPGLAYELFASPDDAPLFHGVEPIKRGSVQVPSLEPAGKRNRYGMRFRGVVDVPAAGDWTFATRSDDGSTLWLDEQRVVDNGGNHAARLREGQAELDAGAHALTLTFHESGGDAVIELLWKGPGESELRPVPTSALRHYRLQVRALETDAFVPDAQRIQRGGERFVEYGCVACHDVGVAAIDEKRSGGIHGSAGPAIAELESLPVGNCLPAPSREGSRARFGFSLADAQVLREYLSGDAQRSLELSPGERADRHLQRLNCLACHRRGDWGGVHPDRKDYFLADEEAELGNESRFPPPLTGVGAKLRRSTLEDVLLRGDSVRPYVRVRMPQFGRQAVGWLSDSLEQADDLGEPGAKRGVDLDPVRLEQAKRLVGRKGLGCIQCHDFMGLPSLGIRAVDMRRMHERLRPAWFRRLLADPAAVNMNTRMANVWVDGRSPVTDILEGDPGAQIELIWDFLSLGGVMPTPEGLAVSDQEYELVPEGRVESIGVFWKNVGPRVLAVGSPEKVHYAFDVGGSRLSWIWRGAFLNARGTWEGRAGELASVEHPDALSLPTGGLVAQLDEWSAPWPAPSNSAGQALGRRIDPDSGHPHFRYRMAGVEVEESVQPRVQLGGATVLRQVAVRADAALDKPLWLRVARGEHIEALETGEFKIEAETPHRVRFESIVGEPRIVLREGGAELRVEVILSPVEGLQPLGANLSWELQW